MARANSSDLLDEYLISYDEDLAIELILKRYTWLREHDSELPDGHVARLKLRVKSKS